MIIGMCVSLSSLIIALNYTFFFTPLNPELLKMSQLYIMHNSYYEQLKLYDSICSCMKMYHVCMHVCMCLHVHVCVWVFVCVWVRVYNLNCMTVNVHACMHCICIMYVCIFACVFMCVSVFVLYNMYTRFYKGWTKKIG